MADWQRKINMKDVWDSGDIQLIAKTAAKRLKALLAFPPEFAWVDDERDELVDELEGLSEDPDAGVRDFDDVWSRVYDWGDKSLDSTWNGPKVCWLQTF